MQVGRALIRSALLLLALTASKPGNAQLSQALLADPAKATGSLIFALQTGDRSALYGWLDTALLAKILSSTSNTGIVPTLKNLGPVVSIETTPAQTDTTRISFSAKVKHQHGMSSWTMAIDRATERLSMATFQISPASNPTAAAPVGPRWDLPYSTTRHSGGFFGRPLSDNGPIASIQGPLIVFDRPNATVEWSQAMAPASVPALAPLAPLDPRVVEFLFATTREQQPPAPAAPSTPIRIRFSGERSPTMTYGVASIRIPDDHKIGRIELPYKWKLFGYTLYEQGEQSQKHFTIRQIATLSPDQWGSVVRAKAAKRALIFVHGYNTSFEDAALRNAQIIWDLQYPGLSVMFTWASRGETASYFYDRESANHARLSFITLLKSLKETYGIEQVDVLAHSMGNLIVLDALSSYAQTSSPTKIGELIMAAPDVDRNLFEQMIPLVHTITAGMTLYASSADKALQLSRIPAGVPRAGDVPAEGPMVLSNLQTIDVTAVGSEIFGLNHTEFAQNRVVMDDIKLILSTGMRPPHTRLSQIRAFPELPAPTKYWRYAE